MSVDSTLLLSRLLAGERLALAKAITMVESTTTQDGVLSRELLRRLPRDRQAIRIAVSGAPGVGKSTFISTLGRLLLAAEKKVAVLAIDPSSQSTGGSIMGDKTRMEGLYNNPNAFIRPSPSTGILGGVNPSTYEVSLLCEAAGGYDYILIETVGVGQSETVAFQLADLFLVLLQPGAGDDLQGLKKGIIERADLLIVNKWDSDLTAQAEQTRASFQQVWSNPNTEVILCSALENRNIEVVLKAIEGAIQSIDFATNKIQREVFWFKQSCKKQILDKIFNEHGALFDQLSQSIAMNEMHYTTAVEKVLEKILP